MNYVELFNIVDEYKASGRSLPCTAVNENEENVIISEGMTDGMHYFHIQTMQNNGHIRVNDYYSNGEVDEYFDDDPERRY